MEFREIHEQNVERDNNTFEDNTRRVEEERIRKQFLDDIEDDLLPKISREEKIKKLEKMKEDISQSYKTDRTNIRHI